MKREQIKESLRKAPAGSEERTSLLEASDSLANEVDGLITGKEEKQEKEKQLNEDLKHGNYFAKSADTFPKVDAVIPNVPIHKITGTSKVFQRDFQFDTCTVRVASLRKALGRHSEADNATQPDISTPAPSETNENGGSASESESATTNSSCSKSQRRAEATACIINGVNGHRGHQGPNGKTCAALWALVYLWMVGITKELKDHLNKINETTNEEAKKVSKERLHCVLVMLAVGAVNESGRDERCQ